MQRKYCSVNEAVAITGLGRTSIALLIKTGKIKSAKVLRRRLCDLESVMSFIPSTNDIEVA
jgi:hypothetical protein